MSWRRDEHDGIPRVKNPPPNLIEEEAPSRFYDARLMRRLLTYMRPHWGKVLGAGLLLSLSSLLQIVGPLLSRLAVDRYTAPVAAPVPTIIDGWLPSDRWSGIAAVSAAYLAILALIALFDAAQSCLMQWAGQLAMSDLRRQVMERLQRLDIEYFDRNPVGRVVTRATSDVDALNDLFTSGLVSIVSDLLMMGIMVIAMSRLSPELTAAVLVVMPSMVFATMRFRRIAAAAHRQIRITVSRINAYLQEHISGMTVVQLFNHERASVRQFDRINEDNKQAYKRAIIAHSWFNPLVEYHGMLAVAGLLAYGGLQTRRGALTLGVLVAFFQYALRFFRPMQELSDKYNEVQSALAASDNIFALLDTPSGIGTPAAARTLPRTPAALEFDRVWFAYKSDEWVLRDVSFTINPGEMVAVVGHTGAGKTTLVNLLLRFYDIQRGCIRIGGVEIRDLDPIDLRRRFGVVLQDPHLFTGTIADNIRLGTDWITDEQVLDSVERVNLRDFIDSLPQGCAEPVRERGYGLSMGQKQLIGFARALAHDPPCLILDVSNASADTETELHMRAAMSAILEGRTAIVIAHRLSTIERASRILVMHKGRLREEGTHRELLAHHGIYWNLHRLQYGEPDPVESEAALVGRHAQGA